MEKINKLNIYIDGDYGCIDVASAKLTGYSIVCDKELARIEQEKTKAEAEYRKLADGAKVVSEACDELASYNKMLFSALADLSAEVDEIIKFENIGNRAALKSAFDSADNILTGNLKYPGSLGSAKLVTSDISALIDAASSAERLLGFLSHHFRGRLPENCLLDMAKKADKLKSELEKFK